MKAWILTIALTPMLSWGNANEAMDLYLNQDYQRAFTLFEKTANKNGPWHASNQGPLGLKLNVLTIAPLDLIL